MKNWIITFIILTLPIIAYWGLENKMARQTSIAYAKEKPTVIKFSSPMCLDCKKLKEDLDSLKPNYEKDIDFIEINATNNDKKTQKQIELYGITVVPTLIFLDSKNQRERKIEGYEKKEHIERYLKELINE